jgi:tryptophan-rich hypothetical protein
MNNLNPKKLLRSKWTAKKPKNKEVHFIISDVEFDEQGTVLSCSMEAIISKRAFPIDWHDLKDNNIWVHGWN